MEITGFNYFRTISGLFKIIETILSLLSFIFATIFHESWAWTELAFLKTTTIMALCYALAIIIFHVTHCSRQVTSIPWKKMDSVISIFLEVLLFISSAMLVYYGSKPASLNVSLINSFGCAGIFVCNAVYNIIY